MGPIRYSTSLVDTNSRFWSSILEPEGRSMITFISSRMHMPMVLRLPWPHLLDLKISKSLGDFKVDMGIGFVHRFGVLK